MESDKKHLKETHPELFLELHPTKNGDLDDTKKVRAGYHGILVFICSQNHEWKCSPVRRIAGSTCYYCSGRKILSGYNDVLTLYPEKIKSAWSVKKNGKIPSDLSPSGSKVFYAKCKKGHHWETKMAEVLRGRGCPYCSNKKVLVGYNDLATIHPELAERVSSESTLSAEQVTAGSEKKLLWNCKRDKSHAFEASPFRLTGKDKRDCPICAGKVVVPGVNDFAFKYPELMKLWDASQNDGVSLEQVSWGSSKMYWWKGECGHSFQKSPKQVAKGSLCPHCSKTNSKLLSGYNDLLTKFPELAEEWYTEKNEGLGSHEVHHGTKLSYWWKCKTDSAHEWLASVSNRTLLNSGCPHCNESRRVSAAESEITSYVESLGFAPVRDRKVLNGKELDIYIPERSFAIEYNGVYWHSEAQGKDRWYHYNKWSECREKGIQLLTVWEDDYIRNPELVKRMIAHKLSASAAMTTYARNTSFTTLHRDEASEFLNDHHIQGAHLTSRHYALRESADNEIVAVVSVTLKKSKTELEITRFTANRSVPGGFSKLMKNVLAQSECEHVKTVVTYSHNDHSWGQVYEHNGFTKIHDGLPGYFYVVNGVREHRLNYSPKRFRERDDLFFEEGKTERELAEVNGLVRIWDSGSTRWEMSVPRR